MTKSRDNKKLSDRVKLWCICDKTPQDCPIHVPERAA